jgi:DGQHR domain-containing protein
MPRCAPDLADFLRREKRLPHLGDATPPWHYRGWLLAYVIELHGVIPAVADRWGYHLRTLETGRLLDEPIAQIAFVSPDTEVFSLLQEWSGLIGRDCGGWSDFRTLLDWLCWGLAVGGEEPRLSDAVNEKLYRRVNVGPLLARPYDYLGEYVAMGKSGGWNPTGFYPTPHNVVELMARMTMADTGKGGKDPRLMTVCDPCVGSGRMLLHASNHSVCLFGQDIDPLGYQRPEVLRHVRQIRQYLESPGALLPGALVVAFDGRVRFTPSGKGRGYSRPGTLVIPLGGAEAEKVGWLVDGQQRAAALRDADVGPFPVCVVGFVAESPGQQREQFLLVNSAKPLPRGLLYELLPRTDALLPEALRKYRLPGVLLDRLNRDAVSPLRGLVRTPTNPDGVLKDTSVLKMLANSLSNGGLFFFRETGEPDVEGMLRLLKDYWAAVAGVFPEAWGRPPAESRLSGGPGVIALGFVMDAIIDRHRHAGLPTRAEFEADLEVLKPVCRWTGGVWEFGPERRRKWNELQNTPNDVRLLSDYLTSQDSDLVCRRVVRTAGQHPKGVSR